MNYSFFAVSVSNKIKTKISVPEFKAQFFNKIDTELKSAYIKNIVKDEKSRKFKGSVFRFVWNGWNVFNPISSGEIEVVNFKNSIYIRHKIYFLEFFVYSLIFSIIPIMGIFDNLLFRIVAFVIIWSIFIGSSLLAASRLINLFNIIIHDINSEKN